MASKIVGVDGDIQPQTDDAPPHGGAGSYPVTPITRQTFYKIAGKLVIVNGQTYPAHGSCVGTMAAQFQTWYKIEGNAVCVTGDKGTNSGPHTLLGLQTNGQNFYTVGF